MRVAPSAEVALAGLMVPNPNRTRARAEQQPGPPSGKPLKVSYTSPENPCSACRLTWIPVLVVPWPMVVEEGERLGAESAPVTLDSIAQQLRAKSQSLFSVMKTPQRPCPRGVHYQEFGGEHEGFKGLVTLCNTTNAANNWRWNRRKQSGAENRPAPPPCESKKT